ncbi:MAG TPA: DUF4835 family protein [Bacteroidales bacterium]|nr:DUF4835 family protein [Bacteroidales bacterium]
MVFRKLFVALFLIISSVAGFGQELRCNVQILSEQIQGTNKRVFETLQNAIFEFMNNRNWTNHVYNSQERIECNMMFNLTEHTGDVFKGTLQVQSRRPVFNSIYNTTLLNYLDQNITFSYVEYEPLEFTETNYTSNLTSLLAYYAFMVIGLDYDSFSYKGGTELFRKAEIVVNNAQQATEKGWKAFEASNNKNRYWLVQNILDEKYSSVRDFIYKYHRLGMDILADKTNQGRNEMLESVRLLQQVYRQKPDPYMHLMQVVYDSKVDEWVNLFSGGFPDEKTRAVQILKEIDPSNSNKYQKIAQN